LANSTATKSYIESVGGAVGVQMKAGHARGWRDKGQITQDQYLQVAGQGCHPDDGSKPRGVADGDKAFMAIV
jgi:hypothetical protein